MRALSWIAAALFFIGCGSKPPKPAHKIPEYIVAPPQPETPSEEAVRAHPPPGLLPYRLLILAGSGVSDLDFFTIYYGMVANGWTVTVMAPTVKNIRTRHGLPVPVTTAVADIDPLAHDILFVPGGAPIDQPIGLLIRTFTLERHLATTRDGAELVASIGLEPLRASNNEHVLVKGNQLAAARAGDLPALLHALQTYGDDRLRR